MALRQLLLIQLLLQMLKQETANFKKIMEESVSDNKKSDFVSQDFKAQMFENEKKGADNLSKADDMGDFVATVFTYLGKITGEDTVDLYNPKVQRSMQGSQFHIQIIQNPILEAL